MPWQLNPFTGNLDKVNAPIEAIVKSITQAGHGFSVGEALYFDGSTWLRANSASINSLGIAIVSSVSDADNFDIILSGPIEGLSGLTAGTWYYVSDSVAGALQTSAGVNFSNPLLLATSATTGIVYQYRADSLTDTTGLTTRSDYDSSFSEYLYTGSATRGSATSASVWKISRFNFTDGSIAYADGNENFDNIYDDRESLTYS
jgi:hypothetical protein